MGEINQRIHIAKLISKEQSEIITEDENSELRVWISSSASNKKEYEKILNELSKGDFYKNYSKINIDEEWVSFSKKNIALKKHFINEYLKYAAIIFLPLIISVLLVFVVGQEDKNINLCSNIIKAGTSKAKLTFADGKIVYLDNKNSRIVHKLGNIVNAENTVIYTDFTENNLNKLQYNKLSIPRGGEYTLVLSDGTKIWLNSETELRYPVVFVGETRQVYLKGEAYFKVAKNKEKPFIVKLNSVDVKVLGTSFNIEAYSDMTSIKTTLIEGSVCLKSKKQNIFLKPNHQAIYKKDKAEIEVKRIDVTEAIAWRNGMFYFEEASLESILERVSRWYDVEIFYQNKNLKDLHFSVEIKRYDNINELLKVIERTGKVRFDIKNKSIVVK